MGWDKELYVEGDILSPRLNAPDSAMTKGLVQLPELVTQAGQL